MPLPPIPLPLAVLRAALGFRRRILDLADAAMPPEVALLDYSWGMQRTKLAGALVTSGLADALGKDSRDPVEVGHELGLEPEVTVRVVEAAVGARLMRLDRRGRARLSRLGAPLRSDHPNSIASWMAYQAAPTRALASGHLEAQMRGGAEPSGHRRAFGGSMWDYFGEHPDEGAVFGRAMREMTAVDVGGIVRAYPWPRQGVICDVSGGIGTLLAAILERRRDARGILLEPPDVLAEAKDFLRSRGVADRVELRPGDLFGELEATADVYVLKWILHDWSDDACREMLARVRATMKPGSKVVVIDQHRERGRPNPVTSMVDLHMLIVCEGGRERSPDEVHGLMRDVGLKPGRVKHAGVQMLVEGVAT
jgi:hypothetical protein